MLKPLQRRLWLVLLMCLTLNVWASENDEAVVLVMGDSLSAGYGIDIEDSWVNLLQDRLGDDYPHRVVNASVSGETSRGGLTRLPALLKNHEPDVVILELGGNDGLRGQAVTDLRENLATMIEMSQASGAQVLLLGMQIPPNYGQRYTRQFANIYPSLAEEYQLPLVEFFLEGVATNVDAMQRDGIHPRAEAQPTMLANVWPALEGLLDKD